MAKKPVKNDNNLAIAYYRYSSHAQNEASIEQQREQAELYAEKHGLQIIKAYEDKAISGTTDDRPGFQLLLSEVGKIKPTALIVWKTDRLGRDRLFLLLAKNKIRDAGCEIHCVAEPIPSDSPEATLMEGMLEAMAEFYSAQLKQNVKRGMRYNAEHGLYNGRRLLGYTHNNNKEYIIDEETAPIVRRIFNDYASGKPLKQIVDELNSQGLTSAFGRPFTINGLRSILKNPAYMGTYHYDDVIIPKGMPVIISEALYNEAQKRFELNRHKVKQSSDEDAPRYWLTGKLYCGECGAPMHGTFGTSKGKYRYYYYDCLNHQKHKCELKPFRKEKLEALVLKILDDFLNDSENLASHAVDISDYYTKMYSDNSYLDSLQAHLDETNNALQNIIRAVERGIISDTIQTRLAELEEQKKALKEAITAEKVKKTLVQDDHSIQHYFDSYAHADVKDQETRDLLLEYFVDKIYVYNDRVVITSKYDDKACELDFNKIDEATASVRHCYGFVHTRLISKTMYLHCFRDSFFACFPFCSLFVRYFEICASKPESVSRTEEMAFAAFALALSSI